jgi:hypothetical protein
MLFNRLSFQEDAPTAMRFARGGTIGDNFYVEPFGRTIKLMSSKPVNYTQGGVIKWEKDQYHPFINSLQHDNKRVLLEYGSMVVPRPVMNLFHDFEKLYGSVKQPQIKDKSMLLEVIVMPEEAIVPRKHVPAMKSFLKKHGVTLPLEHDNLFEISKKKQKLK